MRIRKKDGRKGGREGGREGEGGEREGGREGGREREREKEREREREGREINVNLRPLYRCSVCNKLPAFNREGRKEKLTNFSHMFEQVLRCKQSLWYHTHTHIHIYREYTICSKHCSAYVTQIQ